MKISAPKIVLAITFIVVLVAPMMSTPVAAAPKLGGTLIWAVASDPNLPGLLGAGGSTFLFIQVAQQLFNNLVTCDAKTLQWAPELAQSWQISPDGLHFTFNLVHNATWHDGVPFTSADVKYNYETVAPVYNAWASDFMKSVDTIQTPDNYTVVINMKKPFPAMYSPIVGLGGVGWSIMPKHLYEGKDVGTNEYNNKPVGTGPWKFKEWVKGDHITFVKNPTYFKKGLPYLDQLIFKIIPDASGRALAFEKGDVDFEWALGGLTTADAVRLQDEISSGKLTGKRVWFYPSQSGSADILYLNQLPNSPDPWFKDVRVRKALAYAIDLNKMNELVYFGKATVMTGPVSPAPATAWYYDPNQKQPTYDPTMANKLLDDAGYKPGADGIRFKIRITVDSVGYPQYVKEGEVMRDYLKAVGIQLNIVSLDTAAWHDAVFRRWDYDTFIFPMSTGPDPHLIVRYYTGAGIQPVSWSNAAGYNNTQVNNLFAASELEPDRAKRATLVKQATGVLVNDQAAVWMLARPYVNALNLDFSDEFQPGAWENAGGVAMQRLEGVYWTKGTAITTTAVAIITTPTAAPPPALGTESIVTIVIAIIIIGVGTFYWQRKPKQQQQKT
jgi:peptide/nickel transport system substrate-binding protein